MISAINLSFTVNTHTILDGVNLSVEKGETLAVMGMSGAGKSTLLKCIGGLLRPTAGSVVVDNIDIAKMNEDDLDSVRIRIGMVFQYAALFDSLTVYENVAFGLRRHRHLTEHEIA
ncbi:MAG: ATP-binding cassette domain-containing protein, partial [Armatimonadota bacterium]